MQACRPLAEASARRGPEAFRGASPRPRRAHRLIAKSAMDAGLRRRLEEIVGHAGMCDAMVARGTLGVLGIRTPQAPWVSEEMHCTIYGHNSIISWGRASFSTFSKFKLSDADVEVEPTSKTPCISKDPPEATREPKDYGTGSLGYWVDSSLCLRLPVAVL